MTKIQWQGLWLSADRVVQRMEPLYTPRRLARIRQVIENRTRTIQVGLEGLYDRGNISAVMRSAEALGFLELHNIETSEKFREANRVTKGADKWLKKTTWDDTEACVSQLKSQGFRILVTHLDEDAKPLQEVSFDQKTAIFFGNEKEGASAKLLELSDERVIVPMLGFVESFNISVAAALSLFHIQQARIRELGFHGDLSSEEKKMLYAEYLLAGHKTQSVVKDLALGES